ncbi:C-type lectin lectoxin-Lei1-like [Stigmatopora nigra]
MAFALSSLFLILGICGLLPGVCPFPLNHWKKIHCPPGWTQLDCRCYRVTTMMANFTDAESNCMQDANGNLASIPNMLTNKVVQALFDVDSVSSGWIGLHDAIEDEDFLWTDGSFTNFRNFAMNEPDGSAPCIEMEASDGTWANNACSAMNPYVCVIDSCHGSSSAVPDPCTDSVS